MTYQPPCSSPENDPNDWFISKSGTQYPDDPLEGNTPEAVVAAKAADVERVGRALTEAEERRAENRVADEALRIQLRRRRHAQEACFGCYVRTQCLDKALENEELHGTWGGYTEEQLKEIRQEIARRKSKQ